MNTAEILALFPAKDFTLLAFILGLPLLGAIFNGVFGKRVGKEAVSLMALSCIAFSFVGSVIAFLLIVDQQRGEAAVRFTWTAWEWVTVAGRHDMGRIGIDAAFSIDALSATMALIVTGVGFLIHLYSTKYMEEDPGYHRFFAYLNLFIFSMLVLILGDSLPVLFVGWEGVGLCSYLLIGFWFTEEKNAAAGTKAFVTNRVGDFGLLVAMGLLVYYVGALDWTGLESQRSSLLQPVQIWPIGTHVPLASIFPESTEAWINTPRHVSAATLVGLALFLGCAGKSAQIPLYVWLPDAMAGPTPVSALIHAATMVTAGVYLVCRLSFLFVLSPAAMFTVAFVGVLTAVFAATIAFVQHDIKKVLAYSTVSQLGYMFLGVGVGAFTAGFFHVITHAFFKACLFLGAGSVIHAMHARIHDTDASQDMRNMGGLRKYLPITFWTFAASWAAIVAVPGTSGFFSKDEILFKAYTSSIKPDSLTMGAGAREIEVFTWPEWAPSVLFGLGVLGAVMTAFYMSRLVVGIFFGDFRGWSIARRWKPAPVHPAHPLEPSELEENSAALLRADPHAHAHDESAHHEPYVPGAPVDGPRPHESPWQMTVPLVILAGLALVGGLFNAHAVFHFHPLDDFLAPVFQRAHTSVVSVADAKALEMSLLVPGVLALVVGAGLAYWVYLIRSGEPAALLREQWPRLYRLVYDKWRIDELYEETVIGAVDSLAELAVLFDRWVVDGIIARFTSFLVAATGTVLRYVQTGRVQAYATVMVVGVGGLGWFLIAPHAAARATADHESGKYTLTATPGLGYRYRWDADGDGKWDSEDYAGERTLSFELDVDRTRVVRLEVMNAFGATSTDEFSFHRPKPDKSGALTIGVERGADGRLRGTPQGPGVQQAPGPIDQQMGDAQQRLRGTQDAAENLMRMLRQQQGAQQPGQAPPAQPQRMQPQPGQAPPRNPPQPAPAAPLQPRQPPAAPPAQAGEP
jgi:NADH-quinone oxidoreductase subunit L